jgi:hypothetical protein
MVLVKPAGKRWLYHEPETDGSEWGRLWVVDRLAPADGEAPRSERGAVQGFSWGACDGSPWLLEPDRAGPDGRTVGRVHSIAYVARKGSTVADWEHPFRRAGPVVRLGPAGQIELRGRVKVSDRGIEG